MDVDIHGVLAGVRRAALQAGAAAHAVRVGVGHDRLELDAHRLKAGLDRADALLPVRALAHAEARLDPLEVFGHVGGAERVAVLADEAARGVPLGVVLIGRAQRYLRVDRGRAADAAAADDGERRRAGGRRLDKRRRVPDVVVGVGLPTGEVGGRAMGAGLERKHARAGVGELAGDQAPAGAGPDHDHIEMLIHDCTPRYDQSLLIRIASGGAKPICTHPLGPSAPSATKSL